MKLPTTIKSGRGFSLIEALVVVGIIAIVGIIMTDILSRTIKSGNKTGLISAIKQNGERSLSVMDQTTRFSDQVVCVGTLTANNDTLVVVKNGSYTRFRFFYPTGSTNGYIEQDTFNLNDGSQAGLALCTQSISSAQINTATIYLTDRDTVNGVSLQNGSFSWTHNPGYKDLVNITFNLLPGVGLGPGSDKEVGGSTSFSTTIELR